MILIIEIHYKNESSYYRIDVTRLFNKISVHHFNMLMDMLRTSDVEETKQNCKIIGNHLFARLILDYEDKTAYGSGGKTGYKKFIKFYNQIREFEKELNYEVQS